MEHPYISKLKRDESIKDITKNTLFNKIAYEIAFTEYAFALTNLLHQKRYFRENTDEYLQEARQIVNNLIADASKVKKAEGLPNINYINRVFALPGDFIEFLDKIV